MTERPISDYALLSDRHSAALVGRDGSVDWLCHPRFDSPSVFGALLDPSAGHWSLRPEDPFEADREYVERTMVLRTTFRTRTGAVSLTEALAVGDTGNPHRLGEDAPHLLVRAVDGVEGAVPLRLDWCPRPEYGLVTPMVTARGPGAVARGGPAWLVLSSPVALDVGAGAATARFTVAAGDRIRFGMQWSPITVECPPFLSRLDLEDRLRQTVAAWAGWSRAHRSHTGAYAQQVWIAGRVLQALSYQPTGAIVAAATTSLPETAGGARNWDYRYTWIRDAAFSMDALHTAACPDEALEFFEFMTTAAADHGGDDALQVMYGVSGERELSERELGHLTGWRSSSPVRIGNGAFGQYQLDVYGELLETAAKFRDQLTGADATVRSFLRAAADAAARRWREPDHGIWEIRGGPRHFLHSKIMCWVALDRALDMGDLLEAGERADRWRRERDLIAEAVLTRGWNEAAGAFTQSFGSAELDATALLVPIVGFLPAGDERVIATIDAVAEQLTDSAGLVRRYRSDDGLEGEEGAFVICTFWLAQSLAMADRLDAAEAVFAAAAGCANDVGLLSEQFDAAAGRMLGNFPQAFSHIGLVNAALAIERARQRAANRASATSTGERGGEA